MATSDSLVTELVELVESVGGKLTLYGKHVISTPTTAPRTLCDHCTGVSVYSRKDTAGNTHRSCVHHTAEMEILVREINEWDGAKCVS